jgi:hypothetical protein
VAEQFFREITFLETPAGTLSAADMLLQLLHLNPQVVDGPSTRGKTTVAAATIPPHLFERAKQDAADYIRTHRRLPAEVFIGAESLALEDFAATLAGTELSPGAIRRARGKLAFERFFDTDARGAFDWPIHPAGFAAPELLELARLQGWTLKPARLRPPGR